MHDGYDRDDIYIMVEDEFQSVAQSFTAHLHQAEYKRLVKEAKEAGPKALPEPTSPMSKQAKNRLAAAKLKKRQDDSLRWTGSLRTTGADEEEEEELADLWSGTSLAPLMVSGSQEKRSLVGLQRMSSSTKAGLGITRSQGSQSQPQSSTDRPASRDSDMSVSHAIPAPSAPVLPLANSNWISHARPAPAKRPNVTNRSATASNGVAHGRPAVPQSIKPITAHTTVSSVPAQTQPQPPRSTRPAFKPRFAPIEIDDGFGPNSNAKIAKSKASGPLLANAASAMPPKPKVAKIHEAKKPEPEPPTFLFGWFLETMGRCLPRMILHQSPSARMAIAQYPFRYCASSGSVSTFGTCGVPSTRIGSLQQVSMIWDRLECQHSPISIRRQYQIAFSKVGGFALSVL
jgi:hypothetical protein